MKAPVFYAYPYDQMQEAEFKIRFDGIWFQFFCKRLNDYKRRIHKARALLIREKVITAQPSDHWQLNRKRTLWTFYVYNPPEPISSSDVYWALSNNRNLIETYHQERVIGWEIIRTVRQCYLCDTPYEQESQPYWHTSRNVLAAVCEECNRRLKLHSQKRNLAGTDKAWEKWEWEWDRLRTRDEIDRIASRDRSANLRWVRKFVAQDSFTKSEFKTLCNQHGNVCLRCRKKRVLVADHVIPLALGGKNDITNIQPLCRKCNGIKCVDSTDYRKKI
jgi:5-methylcytosine-specific restriction endonuclease McrA